jgi:hypothetical protein
MRASMRLAAHTGRSLQSLIALGIIIPVLRLCRATAICDFS